MKITLDNIEQSLREDFIITNSILAEKDAEMEVPVSYTKPFLIFQSDHKGATFSNLFHPSDNLLHKKADYVIFTIKKDTLYCIIVELKTSQDPKPQLNMTAYLLEYMIGGILYKYRLSDTQHWIVRKVGLFKQLPLYFKYPVKPGSIYRDGYAFVDEKEFRLGAFLQ